MVNFKYTVVNKAGMKIEGERAAQTREEIVDHLLNQGMTIISIREDIFSGFRKLGNIEIGGMPLKEKVLITKQLSTMIGAGIPVIQAISILKEQSEKLGSKEKFEKIYKKIESGSLLSKAFEDVGGILDEVQVNLIAAGEKSGNLNEMLLKVAEDMQKNKDLRGKIVGALIYPAIIVVVLILVVGLMIIFMIPQVEELYRSLGKTELPFVTRILVQIAKFFADPITLTIIIFVALMSYLGFKNFIASPGGKIIYDGFKLKIPVFGGLMKKIQLLEFCRLISMLTRSGVPIIEAIEIVSRATSNSIYREILTKSKNEVIKGTSLSVAIAKHNIKDAFPSILTKIIATGEDSGKLDKVLDDMYKYYEIEVEQITSNLTKLLEPFILLIVGGLVAFLAIAIYLPLYSVGT